MSTIRKVIIETILLIFFNLLSVNCKPIKLNNKTTEENRKVISPSHRKKTTIINIIILAINVTSGLFFITEFNKIIKIYMC